MLSKNSVLLIGAILCALAVAIGAFGAHGLSAILEHNDRVDTFLLANRYQFYHGLSLLFIGARYEFSVTLEKVMALALFLGVLIFSGSLYCLATTDIRWFGAIAPIGGTLLLIGWTSLVVTIARNR